MSHPHGAERRPSSSSSTKSKVPVAGTLLIGLVVAGIATALWLRYKSLDGNAPTVEKLFEWHERSTRVLLGAGPIKIAPSVYFLGNMRPSAVYVVETDEGLVMVDAGLESAHDGLLAALSELGLDPGRLKMILLTHAHGDHTLGAQRLRDETGAEVFIGREDAEPLRRGGPWEAIFSKFAVQGESLHPTTIDGELVDNQVIEFGRAKFTVAATPGHTPGSCCFLLELNGQRIVFTGDTLQNFTSNVGTYVAGLPPAYRGEVSRYLHSLERLRDLPVPNLVLPGHPVADGEPDPRLTEVEWTELIDRGIVDLTKWKQRYERDGEDFLDGRPKELLSGLYYLGDFEGGACYALVSEQSALLFDAARGDDAARRLVTAWETLGRSPPPIAAVVLTSCDAQNLTGLRSIVESAGCKVVAPSDGVRLVANSCPDVTGILAAEGLADLGWSDVGVLAIAGAGEPQAAYYFRRGGRTVLISGAWPIDADDQEFTSLARRGPPRGFDAKSLTKSLGLLQEVNPNVWLPAAPWKGRNANLYDRAWANNLLLNQELLRSWEDRK
jgi:glyoxylase-like metal-dependent hydrolase (beta-lactamase superfamily II)